MVWQDHDKGQGTAADVAGCASDRSSCMSNSLEPIRTRPQRVGRRKIADSLSSRRQLTACL